MERTYAAIKSARLFCGPMSKNLVDGTIHYANSSNNLVGLIATRRQIDHRSGYVNNWTTDTFSTYVKDRSDNVLLCRDHGGIFQGDTTDEGMESFSIDTKWLDIIHIDPWKALNSVDEAAKYTARSMCFCFNMNPHCWYEVATEEAIHSMTPEMLDTFLALVKEQSGDIFERVAYAVIQSGTSLQSGYNTGQYSEERLVQMLSVCGKYGLLSKEHNGDYLNISQVKRKFELGLSAINIAPEFAEIESLIVLKHISDTSLWLDLVLKDKRWEKWFPHSFDPITNTKTVLQSCGHYVFSYPEFAKVFDLTSIAEEVSSAVYAFYEDRIK